MDNLIGFNNKTRWTIEVFETDVSEEAVVSPHFISAVSFDLIKKTLNIASVDVYGAKTIVDWFVSSNFNCYNIIKITRFDAVADEVDYLLFYDLEVKSIKQDLDYDLEGIAIYKLECTFKEFKRKEIIC